MGKSRKKNKKALDHDQWVKRKKSQESKMDIDSVEEESDDGGLSTYRLNHMHQKQNRIKLINWKICKQFLGPV